VRHTLSDTGFEDVRAWRLHHEYGLVKEAEQRRILLFLTTG